MTYLVSGAILASSVCTRVALVDEHDVVRAGIESWLSGEHVTVVGSFAHCAKFLDWLPSNGVDVLVAEIQENGHAPDLECLRELCAAGPAVVVYSRLTAPEIILSTLDAGALSYVAKADGMAHLIAALTHARDGRPYVSPRTAAATDDSQRTGRLSLSNREKQVLTAWLRTDSKEDVARELHIAIATVRTHLQRVRIKYAQAGRAATTKSALLARAIEDGIVGLSDLSAG